jgi:hypothetical protein
MANELANWNEETRSIRKSNQEVEWRDRELRRTESNKWMERGEKWRRCGNRDQTLGLTTVRPSKTLQ